MDTDEHIDTGDGPFSDNPFADIDETESDSSSFFLCQNKHMCLITNKYGTKD